MANKKDKDETKGTFIDFAIAVIQGLTKDIYIVMASIILCAGIIVLFRGAIGVYFLIFLGFMGILAFGVRYFTEREAQEEKQSEKSVRTRPLVSRGRYFIGIDIGAGEIDYCILDYEPFFNETNKSEDDVVLYTGLTESPETFPRLYEETKKIIEKLAKCAKESRIFPIHGIGIGLPGMVNPKTGMLVNSPSFNMKNLKFVQELYKKMDWTIIKDIIPDGEHMIPIEIDNDVRCATRFRWKSSPKIQNLVCIYIGNGLGSGIVANGKMLYGKNFSAGEAGHTTISFSPDLFHSPLEKCHCGNKGHHWEMYVCSYGILHMIRNLDKEKYKRFEEKYLKVSDKPEEKKELTTYVIRDAYYDGDPYASMIVNNFFDYTSIGIANYINILNPEEIILGGGMIRAFYDKDKQSPYFKRTGHELLWEKICEYAIPTLVGDYLTVEGTPKQYLSSIGAALIFKDASYYEFKNQ